MKTMAFTRSITGFSRSGVASQFRPTRIVHEAGTALTLETGVDTVVLPIALRNGEFTSPVVSIPTTTTIVDVLLSIDPVDYVDITKLVHLHVERFESGSWVRRRSFTWSGGAFVSKAGVNAMPRKQLAGLEFASYQIRVVAESIGNCNVGISIQER